MQVFDWHRTIILILSAAYNMEIYFDYFKECALNVLASVQQIITKEPLTSVGDSGL